MKKNEIAWSRYATALSLIFTVFLSSSMVVLGAKDTKGLAGEITVLGSNGNADNPPVRLNGGRVFSGQTFFSSGVISTSETSSATVNLGKLGRINLSPNSTLSLNFSENNISGNLSAGQIKIFAKEGVLVNIQTIDGTIKNDAGQTGVFTIDVQSGKTETITEQGVLSLNNGEISVPAPQSQQNRSKRRYLIPALIVAGIVGAVIIAVVVSNDDDDDVSPVR